MSRRKNVPHIMPPHVETDPKILITSCGDSIAFEISRRVCRQVVILSARPCKRKGLEEGVYVLACQLFQVPSVVKVRFSSYSVSIKYGDTYYDEWVNKHRILKILSEDLFPDIRQEKITIHEGNEISSIQLMINELCYRN